MKLNVKRGFKAGTKISTIEVPKELRVKRPSGIDFVDLALGRAGGFVPTTTMMLTGGPGTGKSTLLRQLAASLAGQDYVPVLNSGEENLYQIKMSSERLKLGHDFMVAEEEKLPPLLEFLDKVKKENPNKQVCYLQDSLQTLDDGFYRNGTNGVTPVRCAERIVDWTQRNFGISIFIGQATKSGEYAGKQTIKHAVDIHAHLFFDKKPKSPTFKRLLLEVQKNRWGVTGESLVMKLTTTGMEFDEAFQKSLDFEFGDDEEPMAAE